MLALLTAHNLKLTINAPYSSRRMKPIRHFRGVTHLTRPGDNLDDNLPPEQIISPLTENEMEHFCYHLGVASMAYRSLDPPDDFVTEFIALSFRLLSSYRHLMEDRWKCEKHGG